MDYVVKPFSPTELSARLRAALRRRAVSEPSVLGDLVVDYADRRVTFAGRPVESMAIEYRLLVEVSANAVRVLTYDHLPQRVWDEKSSSDMRPMRIIVSKLRRKRRPRRQPHLLSKDRQSRRNQTPKIDSLAVQGGLLWSRRRHGVTHRKPPP